MELNINPKTNKYAMLLTNADNDAVYVEDQETFFELVSIAGIEKVEIYYPKAGWLWLETEIEQWAGQKFDDENEDELLEAWFEFFEGETERL